MNDGDDDELKKKKQLSLCKQLVYRRNKSDH